MKSLYADAQNRQTGLNATPISDWVNARVLAAATAETSTPPTNAKYVIITPTDPTSAVWIKLNGTAAAPSADLADGSASIPVTVPRIFTLDGVTSIGVISAAAQTVTFEYFA